MRGAADPQVLRRTASDREALAADYESVALPLSYPGVRSKSLTFPASAGIPRIRRARR